MSGHLWWWEQGRSLSVAVFGSRVLVEAKSPPVAINSCTGTHEYDTAVGDEDICRSRSKRGERQKQYLVYPKHQVGSLERFLSGQLRALYRTTYLDLTP